MPQFRKETFTASNSAGTQLGVGVTIKFSAEGKFYVNLPDWFRDAFSGQLSYVRGRGANETPGTFRMMADTLELLRADIQAGLALHLTPEVTENPVVRYNIESHVSFATDAHGNIFPNAGFEGARWPEGESRAMLGDHHATNPTKGGYSLVVGARAMLKRTIRHGSNVRVEYENFYDGGSHLGSDNPANLLNSWAAMDLGKNPKELPYTPKTALFFHNLLLAMARLNQQIQAATLEQESLLQLIDKQASLLVLQGPKMSDLATPRNA
jgi:hypothetical protein